MDGPNCGIKTVRMSAHIIHEVVSLIYCVIFYNNGLFYFVYF
ncbi:hypothetical protein FQV37_1207 [Psychrobacter nivimaris]|uniref:Uncharacterized protein n=1 Tax=Psychrobacter nivimaris TaxID=281738 RepID=A0A6N7C096_9GAMM|nr:hypothetical protein FQV37_1207 [Psychrobacter nivimaris]